VAERAEGVIFEEEDQGHEFDLDQELTKVDDELIMEEANLLSAKAHRLDLGSLGLLSKVTPLKVGGDK
jgi:hypothetical protein